MPRKIQVSYFIVPLLAWFATGCGGGGSGNGDTQPATFTVSTNVVGNGSISPTSASVSSGGNASFTLTPDEGHHIESASGCDGSLVDQTYTTGTINASCTVTVTFEINQYTITANAGDGGDISPTTQTVNHGSQAVFSVTPNAGYAIATVTGCDGSLQDTTYTTAAVTEDCSIEATFAISPDISISDASVTEADDGALNMTFSVSLSQATSIAIDVNYWTLSQTAFQGRDYMPVSGTLNFAVGEVSKEISVTIKNDHVFEPQEQFELVLGTPSIGQTTKRVGVGTIVDNDSANRARDEALLRSVNDILTELREEETAERGSFSTRIFAVMDLDADGDEDILLFTRFGFEPDVENGSLWILRNDGAGLLERQDSGLTAWARQVSVADINNDGLEDVFIADHGPHADDGSLLGAQDRLLLQTQSGLLQDVSDTSLPVSINQTHSSCIGDFNRDSQLDIYSGVLGAPELMQNQGNTTFEFVSENPFSPYVWSPAPASTWCLVDDFTGDGQPDLILGSANETDRPDHQGNIVGEVHALFRNSEGSDSGLTFDYPGDFIDADFVRELGGTPIIDHNATLGMVGVDFNRDGCQDFATYVTDYDTESNVHVYQNDCQGGFTRTQVIASLSATIGKLAAADVDSDGDIDLVLSHEDINSTENFRVTDSRILLNNGSGEFTVSEGEPADLGVIPFELGVMWVLP